jgi:uncharacterized protein (DUF2147 family)
MVNIWRLALIAALVALLSPALAAEPFGKWMRPSTGAEVNFFDCGGKLCGKIASVKDKRRAGEVGTIILSDAVSVDGTQWKGRLLDTDNGKTYSGVVTLEGSDGLNLKGCIGIICQGETWRRVH